MEQTTQVEVKPVNKDKVKLFLRVMWILAIITGFEFAIFFVFENRRDNWDTQAVGANATEVLVRSEIHQTGTLGFFDRCLERIRDDFIPERVEVFSSSVLEPRAHFQSIGLDQVEWSQQAVETAEHAQVLLSEVEVGSLPLLAIEPLIDISLERQNRLLRVCR